MSQLPPVVVHLDGNTRGYLWCCPTCAEPHSDHFKLEPRSRVQCSRCKHVFVPQAYRKPEERSK